MAEHYELYTDGSCSGNPGDGGFGCVILKNGQMCETFHSGMQHDTTNNAEELKACIFALSWVLGDGCRNISVNVDVYSDSSYLCRGATEWLDNWYKSGWVKSNGDNIKNQGLWKTIYNLIHHHHINVTFHWVRGHNGNHYNEQADKLAKNRDALNSNEYEYIGRMLRRYSLD